MITFLKNVWTKITGFTKVHPAWSVEIGVLLLVFGLGVLAGYKFFHKPPNTITTTTSTTDTETKNQLNTAQQQVADLEVQLSTATKTISDLQSQTKTTIHTVTTPDGGTVTDETIEQEFSNMGTTQTQTNQNTNQQTVDNTQTQKVDESAIHNTITTTTTVTQQGSSKWRATVDFGYMWDFANPGAKGSMYTSLDLSYNVIWIIDLHAFAFEPINNPTKPITGAGVQLDLGKLFGGN